MKTLTPEILLRAYTAGIFPMSEGRDDPELFWVDPENRGIIPLESFHVPGKLRRRVRNNSFKVRCDTAFALVMEHCAGQHKTAIAPGSIRLLSISIPPCTPWGAPTAWNAGRRMIWRGDFTASP